MSLATDTPKLPPRYRERPWTGRVLCFAACVLAVNALIGERGLSETLRARRDFHAAVAELSRLQYENVALTDAVHRLRHDASTIEGVARADLGLIKPGEVLVVVKARTQQEAAPSPVQPLPTSATSPAPATSQAPR